MKNSVVYALVIGLLILGGVYLSDYLGKQAQIKELQQLQSSNGVCDGRWRFWYWVLVSNK